MTKSITLTAVVHQEGEWFVANCPEVGTVSQGKNFQEAVSNLQEATDLYLEEFGVEGVSTSKPIITTFESAFAANA